MASQQRIFTAQSGTPFSVLMPCADINAQGNNCRPNRIANGDLASGQRSIAEWFDTIAFRDSFAPGVRQRGTQHPAWARPTNVDFALSKSFLCGKNRDPPAADSVGTVQRSESHQFGLPINSTDSPAFGTITSAAPRTCYPDSALDWSSNQARLESAWRFLLKTFANSRTLRWSGISSPFSGSPRLWEPRAWCRSCCPKESIFPMPSFT